MNNYWDMCGKNRKTWNKVEVFEDGSRASLALAANIPLGRESEGEERQAISTALAAPRVFIKEDKCLEVISV